MESINTPRHNIYTVEIEPIVMEYIERKRFENETISQCIERLIFHEKPTQGKYTLLFKHLQVGEVYTLNLNEQFTYSGAAKSVAHYDKRNKTKHKIKRYGAYLTIRRIK